MQLCWVILVVVLLASAVGFRLGQKKRRVDQSVARRFAGAGPQVGSSAFKFDKEFIEDLASELELCPETRAVLEKNRFTRDILMNVAEKSELQTAFGIEIMDAFKIVSWALNAAKMKKAEERRAAKKEKAEARLAAKKEEAEALNAAKVEKAEERRAAKKEKAEALNAAEEEDPEALNAAEEEDPEALNAAKKEKAEERRAARDEKYSRSKEVFIFSLPSRRYYKYTFLGQFEFQSFLNTWRVTGIASVLDKEVETEVAGQSVTCIVAINSIERLVNGTLYHLIDLPRNEINDLREALADSTKA